MDDVHIEKTLRNINLLGAVPPGMLEDLERACEWHYFASDQIVVDRNDDTSDVYFIVKGRVEVLDFVRGGREIVLVEMSDGDTFGEMSAVDNKRRSARVRTISPTMVARMSSGLFRETLHDVPDMAMALLELFSSKVRSLSGRVTALSSLSPRQQIFRELLRIAEPNAECDGSWIINHLPGHGEIADGIGVEREHVAKAVGELAREKIVERKTMALVIRDYKRLMSMADG